jgi:hypothetical protein
MASLQQRLIIGGLEIIGKKKQWGSPERLIAAARAQHAKGPAQPPAKLARRVTIQMETDLGFSGCPERARHRGRLPPARAGAIRAREARGSYAPEP